MTDPRKLTYTNKHNQANKHAHAKGKLIKVCFVYIQQQQQRPTTTNRNNKKT